MPATAYLFPGQGSQTDAMREEVERLRPDLLDAAVEAAGEDPFARVDEDTRFAQPALLAASLARWSTVAAPHADAFLGHSLGELAALAAAGAIADGDAVALAAVRGRLMSRAAAKSEGGMLALLGALVGDAHRLAAEHGLTVANDNAPGQLVLAGPRDKLAVAAAAARAEGIKTMRLGVAGAFHSPAMAAVRGEWESALADVDIDRPGTLVYSCLTGAPIADPRAALADALTAPVLFRQALVELAERAAIVRFVEVGPGRVLTGLVRRTLPAARAETLELPEAIRA
ncbi:MAG: ACP S-malonyltransferase [Thermoleophilaceae bacterium]